MKSTLFSILLMFTMTTGCLKTEPRREVNVDVETPQSWQALANYAKDDALVQDQWWRDFGDSNLTEVVEKALLANRSLQEAQAHVRASSEVAKAAGANRYPQLGLNVNSGRQKQNFIGLPLGDQEVFSTTYPQHGMGLTASWEADLWGRISAQVGEASSEHQANLADLQALRLSIAGQTAKTWLWALEAAQQEALAEEMTARFQREANQVQNRYEKGLKSSLDVRLSQSNHASTSALLQQRKQQRAGYARQLRVLMGNYPHSQVFEEQNFPQIPATAPVGLPADLISRRPDMAAAEYRLIARDYSLAAARRSLYPRLNLTASAGSSSSHLSDLLKGDFSVWSLAGGLVQPLFQGGRLKAAVRGAEARVDAQLHHFANKALVAYGEVEGTLENEKWLRLQEADLARAHAQSEAAAQRAEDSYYKGLADYVSVLVAQRQVLQAKSQLITVRAMLLVNRVDLYMALGGGFQNPVHPQPRS